MDLEEVERLLRAKSFKASTMGGDELVVFDSDVHLATLWMLDDGSVKVAPAFGFRYMLGALRSFGLPVEVES